MPRAFRLREQQPSILFSMCDYSLHSVKSRPAEVGDKLTTHNFNTGTRGFAAPEDVRTAVCVLPGTELAFAKEVKCGQSRLFGWKANTVNHTTAIFRQINKDNPRTHHDARYRSRGKGPGTGRARRLICKLQQGFRAALDWAACFCATRLKCSRHDARFRLLSAQEKTLALMGARVSRPDGVRGWGWGALHPALAIQRWARPCGFLPGKAQRPRAAAMHR